MPLPRHKYTGNLLSFLVTLANEQARAQVAQLAQQVQEAMGQSVEVAFMDRGYSGPRWRCFGRPE